MILHLETINTVEELRKKYNKAKLSENSPEVKIFIRWSVKPIHRFSVQP